MGKLEGWLVRIHLGWWEVQVAHNDFNLFSIDIYWLDYFHVGLDYFHVGISRETAPTPGEGE